MTEYLEQGRVEYVGGLYIRTGGGNTYLTDTAMGFWPTLGGWLETRFAYLGIEVGAESPAQFRIVIERLGSAQELCGDKQEPE